ncbi:hypothetical protein MNBD_GAMMA07-35 [hydrothermal vent metagenome]|uniref:Uncharacterized protein n=1 Tax=hydrothermal vent metagenome TaxID=652676 RepID=A0A3B0WP53_9ZZZZ
MKYKMTRETGWILSILLFIFSIACGVAILYFSKTEIISVTNLNKTGGMVGPIEVKKENSIYVVMVKQYVNLNEWSAIDIGVYDESEKYLFSFNGEMWHESGYDEGYWEEDESSYELPITFNKPGKYMLDVSVESSNAANVNDLVITIKTRRGSAFIFYWLGSISLVFIYFVFKQEKQAPKLKRAEKKPALKQTNKQKTITRK